MLNKFVKDFLALFACVCAYQSTTLIVDHPLDLSSLPDACAPNVTHSQLCQANNLSTISPSYLALPAANIHESAPARRPQLIYLRLTHPPAKPLQQPSVTQPAQIKNLLVPLALFRSDGTDSFDMRR